MTARCARNVPEATWVRPEEPGGCLGTSKGCDCDLAALPACRCVNAGGSWPAGFLRCGACGSLFWRPAVVANRGEHVRAACPGAPARACDAHWQLRRDAAGPATAGHAGCGPADRRTHDRRRCWPSREQVGPGYAAAPKLAPVSRYAQCHQPGPGDSNLPGGPPWARGADVLPHLLPSHPPPTGSGDYRQLPRCQGRRHPLNGGFGVAPHFLVLLTGAGYSPWKVSV